MCVCVFQTRYWRSQGTKRQSNVSIYLQKKNRQIVVEKNTERETNSKWSWMHTKHERTMRMDCHKNTASLLEYFAERVSDWIYVCVWIDWERFMMMNSKMRWWRRRSFLNYPGVYIGWIVCSFGDWIVDGFKNWTSKSKAIELGCRWDGRGWGYLEIKPPPTGSASRIDDWSLRDVTTCCQTVFESRLALFAWRLRISMKKTIDRLSFQDHCLTNGLIANFFIQCFIFCFPFRGRCRCSFKCHNH